MPRATRCARRSRRREPLDAADRVLHNKFADSKETVMTKRVFAFLILATRLVAITLFAVAGEMTLYLTGTPFWLVSSALAGWMLSEVAEVLLSEWES